MWTCTEYIRGCTTLHPHAFQKTCFETVYPQSIQPAGGLKSTCDSKNTQTYLLKKNTLSAYRFHRHYEEVRSLSSHKATVRGLWWTAWTSESQNPTQNKSQTMQCCKKHYGRYGIHVGVHYITRTCIQEDIVLRLHTPRLPNMRKVWSRKCDSENSQTSFFRKALQREPECI